MRGFSMGGAAAWHFAAHYAGLWAAAAPGAGFSETPEFLKVWQKETLQPTAVGDQAVASLRCDRLRGEPVQLSAGGV